MIPFALLALIAQVAAAQPPANTTDVDDSTTPAQASPLAPTLRAAPPQAPAPGARSLDDILSTIPPYEPPADTKLAPEERPRPGVVIAPVSPTAPSAAGPTFLNDVGSRPDGPPTDSDTLYETRILGAFRAAQGSQGPLDGRWLVAKAGGGVLYTLQFADRGGGQVEGAWRDMKAGGQAATGFIDTVEHDNADTVVRFKAEASAKGAEVRIHPSADGGWVGEAITPSGKVPVVMTRDHGIELAAQGVPTYIPPPAPVVRSSRHSGGKHAKASAKSHGKSSPSPRALENPRKKRSRPCCAPALKQRSGSAPPEKQKGPPFGDPSAHPSEEGVFLLRGRGGRSSRSARRHGARSRSGGRSGGVGGRSSRGRRRVSGRSSRSGGRSGRGGGVGGGGGVGLLAASGNGDESDGRGGDNELADHD